MRKGGNDFHKDKDVEEFVKPWLMRENTHVSSSLPYQTTFIEEWLLVVEAVIVLGVGWKDCQSMPIRTLHHG